MVVVSNLWERLRASVSNWMSPPKRLGPSWPQPARKNTPTGSGALQTPLDIQASICTNFQRYRQLYPQLNDQLSKLEVILTSLSKNATQVQQARILQFVIGAPPKEELEQFLEFALTLPKGLSDDNYLALLGLHIQCYKKRPKFFTGLTAACKAELPAGALSGSYVLPVFKQSIALFDQYRWTVWPKLVEKIEQFKSQDPSINHRALQVHLFNLMLRPVEVSTFRPVATELLDATNLNEFQNLLFTAIRELFQPPLIERWNEAYSYGYLLDPRPELRSKRFETDIVAALMNMKDPQSTEATFVFPETRKLYLKYVLPRYRELNATQQKMHLEALLKYPDSRKELFHKATTLIPTLDSDTQFHFVALLLAEPNNGALVLKHAASIASVLMLQERITFLSNLFSVQANHPVLIDQLESILTTLPKVKHLDTLKTLLDNPAIYPKLAKKYTAIIENLPPKDKISFMRTLLESPSVRRSVAENLAENIKSTPSAIQTILLTALYNDPECLAILSQQANAIWKSLPIPLREGFLLQILPFLHESNDQELMGTIDLEHNTSHAQYRIAIMAELMALLNSKKSRQKPKVAVMPFLLDPYLGEVRDRTPEALTSLVQLSTAIRQSSLPSGLIDRWAEIGSISHRFASWKYDTRGKNSLFKQFGFQFKPTHPNHPEYGPAYYVDGHENTSIGLDPMTNVEFRQAFVSISHPKYGQLVIRNSSPNEKAGRNKMQYPAYLIPKETFTQDFREIPDFEESNHILSSRLYSNEEKVAQTEQRLGFLLDELAKVVTAYRQWKFDAAAVKWDPELQQNVSTADMSPGFERTLVKWMELNQSRKPGEPAVSLAFVDPKYPPWVLNPYTGYVIGEGKTKEKGQTLNTYDYTPSHVYEVTTSVHREWDTDMNPQFLEGINFRNFLQQAGINNRNAELILVDAA